MFQALGLLKSSLKWIKVNFVAEFSNLSSLLCRSREAAKKVNDVRSIVI